MTQLEYLPLSVWLTPGVLVWIVLAGVAYAWLVWGRGRDLWGDGDPPTAWQALSFYAALLALYAAIGSPLGVLAMGYSFTAHMLQHIIAAVAVPPLLISGLPPALWRRLLRPPFVRMVFRRLVRPVTALVLFNLVFAALVWPPLVVAMVQSMTVMVILHLLLVGVGILAWWPIVSPLPEEPRLHPAVQMLYLFANGLPMLLPLALVMLAPPLYAAAYAGSPHLFGLGLLADQQLGAAICLTVVHAVYGTMVMHRFRQWARVERSAAHGGVSPDTLAMAGLRAGTPARLERWFKGPRWEPERVGAEPGAVLPLFAVPRNWEDGEDEA